MRRRLRSTTLLLILLASCQGPDPVRYQAERASHALAARCADGWFSGLPAPLVDQELVRKSLDDWARRLDSDARLLGDAAVDGGR